MDPKTRLILIRHGETDWNTEGRWQGQIDLPLNAKGIKQAEQIARSLFGSKISAIYSSDLNRAVETAKALQNVTGLPIIIDPRLREVHQGEWQGRLVKEIKKHYAAEFQKRLENPWDIAPPGGETANEVHERVIEAIREVIKKHVGKTIAIVSHGFVIAVVWVHFKKIPFELVWDFVPSNASIRELEVES